MFCRKPETADIVRDFPHSITHLNSDNIEDFKFDKPSSVSDNNEVKARLFDKYINKHGCISKSFREQPMKLSHIFMITDAPANCLIFRSSLLMSCWILLITVIIIPCLFCYNPGNAAYRNDKPDMVSLKR